MAVSVAVPGRAALLRPTPGRTAFAIRLASVCTLTVLVAELYQTPDVAVTAYVAFFVVKPDRPTSVLTSLVMTVVITVVLLLVLGVAALVIDHPFWRVAAMATISFGLLFLGSASKLRPVASTMALIVAYALDLLGGVSIGEEATRALLYAWLFVAIPAAICVGVSLISAPSARRRLEQGLAARLEAGAGALAGDPAAVERLSVLEQAGEAELRGALHLTGLEGGASPAERAALAAALSSTVAIVAIVDMGCRDPAAMPPMPWRGAIARLLLEVAGILRAGAYPVDITVPALTERASPAQLAMASDIGAALAAFAEAGAGAGAGPPAPADARHGFFLADAFTSRRHVRGPLKTTAAAMGCYVLFQLLDWPGIHTCMITCYVAALESAGESFEKLALRLAGCAVGAALGFATLLFVIPGLDSIATLLGVVFAGAFVGGYVAAGGPRVDYAGLQIALAFFLIVLQGPAPAFDLTIGRDRLLGVLIGNLAVFLVFTRVWPISIAGRIDPALAGLLRSLAALAREAGQAARRSLAMDVRAAARAMSADLQVSRYEPRSIRPADDWLAVRRVAVAAAGRLRAPLLASGEAGRPDLQAAARLERVAATLGGGPSGSNGPAPLAAGLFPIEAELTEIEALATGPAHDPA